MSNFNAFMSKSTAFLEKNKPEILKNFSGFCALHSIELDDSALAKLLDQYAGIDYILVESKSKKLFGVAARVNFWSQTIGCLTIRYKRRNGTATEYEKRRSSVLKNDSFYPQITIQIDASKEGNLLGGIFLKTAELYKYIETNKPFFINSYMRTCNEGNQYLAIPYKDLLKFGLRCKILEPQTTDKQTLLFN